MGLVKLIIAMLKNNKLIIWLLMQESFFAAQNNLCINSERKKILSGRE